MAIKIGSNIASLNAQRRLADAGYELSNTFERLSSGQRINRASDDAAGLAIADDLKAKGRIYTQAIRNGNDGISLLNIADSAIDALTSVVIRIRELSEQSANGSYSNKQREAIDTEAQQLSKEFTRITQTTSFNGLKVFDGSLGSGVRLQLGIGTEESINASIGGAIGTGTFKNETAYTTGTTSARSVSLTDLNADGILDMVTAGTSGSAGTITVQLGRGDGSFAAATSYSIQSTVSGANSLAIEDLNGDGILDIAVAAGNRAYTMFGTGGGSFAAASFYTMDSNSSLAMAAADLNGDGIVDLITGGNNVSIGTFAVRLGTGNGSFGNVTVFSSGHSSTNALTLADLNNDGFLDLATGGTGGNISIKFGIGDGTFGSPIVYSAPSIATSSILFEDLNNDGILDMTAAHLIGSGKASIRLGNGDGTFGESTVYSFGIGSTRSIASGDLNQDGIRDLVFAGNSGSIGQIAVLFGSGNGAFSNILASTNSNANWDIAMGDLNGDGVLDIATAGDLSGGKTTVMMANTKEGLGALLEFSLKTRQSSLQSMNMLDRTLQNLSKQRGTIGASQSRINIALNNLQSARENFSAAESRIRDADIAQESARLVRTQILQQAASSVLAQTNQSPALALKLLN